MKKAEELPLKLREGYQVVDRSDGTFVVINAESTNYLVIDQLEVNLVREFDGRTLSEIAYSAYLKYNYIPFQKLKSLTGQMAARGMLEESRAIARLFDAEERSFWKYFLGALSITLYHPRRTLPEKGGAGCTGKGPPPLLFVVLFALGAGLTAYLGLPQVTGMFDTESSCAMAALSIYLSLSFACLIKSLVRILCLASCGLAPGPFMVHLTFGVISIDPGSGSLVRAPRPVRLTASLISLASLFLVSSLLWLFAVMNRAGAPEASLLLSLASTGVFLAMFLDLCPVGPTTAYEFYSSYSKSNEAVQSGFTYLRSRMLKRLFTTDLNETEKPLIVFCCWTFIWCISLFSLGADFMEKNKEALALLYINGSGIFTTVLVVLLVAALCLISFTVLLGLVSALIGFLKSLLPRKSLEKRHAELKSLEKEKVMAFLKSVPFFSQAPGELLDRIADSSKNLAFSQGDIIIRQGEEGDSFFVITEGEALVVREEDTGQEVHVARLITGDSFGEVALVEQRPRTATVKALTAGSALAIGRDDFLKAAEAIKGSDVVALVQGYHMLYNSPFFSSLETEAIAQLLHMVERITVEPGQAVIRHGDRADHFYVVLKGELEVMDKDEKTVIRTLSQGDPFGEIALLTDSTRTATVIARTPGSLIALGRESFNEFFSRYFSLGEKLERLGVRRLSDYSGGTL
ncbi:MAG: cyclic nucleotide-binding domain-containing protein [Candidatus Eremiobacteraeota bacterium]|nr:cyclic nucleotide-binding domain-containing protein [Candidatus Eremiobacteraeota bacterium]